MGSLNLDSPELLVRVIESIVIATIAFLLFFGLKRALHLLSQRASIPALAFTPVRVLLRYSILVMAGALILSRFGINVNGILTVVATGLAMVAIGFVAVWSVLSNFLCTFVLIIFKPFSVGDDLEIPVDSIKGKVVDLTLVFTILRGENGELYHIPNNMFFQKVFRIRQGKKSVDLDVQLHQPKPIDAQDKDS